MGKDMHNIIISVRFKLDEILKKLKTL
jgi:hypothetical protein